MKGMFDTNVKVMFDGIPSRGESDESVKNQDQYRRFYDSSQYDVAPSSGHPLAGLKLTTSNATYADYLEWIRSVKEDITAPLNFEVIEVWTLVKFADNLVLRSYADPLYNAFMWFIRPVVYRTDVTLDIQSALLVLYALS